MAIDVSLSQLGSLSNETTALSVINGNTTAITNAFLDAVALDGTAPNQMQANLDMNGFSIINCSNLISFLSYTVSTLPVGPVGSLAYVTDGTSGLSWGATVTGGHSTTYLVWFNGTAWTVIGQ